MIKGTLSNQWVRWILVGLAAGLMFYRLGQTALTNWDEAWFASVAADMVKRGDWLAPQWNGETWFYEPPLLTWVLAGVMKFVNSDEVWLRLFNVICGLGTIVMVMVVSKFLWPKNKLALILSATVLISDIEFLFRARQINTDIPLTFLMLTAIYGFMRIDKLVWWLVGWSAWGLAFLTKRATPLLLLPALIFVVWRFRKRLQGRALYWGIGVFLLIVIPWHGYMWLKFGKVFTDKYFLGYTLGKLVSVNPSIGIDAIFYIKSVAYAFRFWALALPLAGVWMIKKARTTWRWRVMLIYAGTVTVLLTLTPIKASWYLLPIHPVIAILIGSFLAEMMAEFPKTRVVILCGVMVMSVGQLWAWRDSYMVPETTRHQAEMARLIGSLGDTNEVYLDDDYLPVAVFYSGKQVRPLRFNREAIYRDTPLKFNPGALILTSMETQAQLRLATPNLLNQIAENRDLLLLRAQ